MIRIAIGGFFHESNTFNPIITGKEDFIIFEKDEIFSNKDAFLLAKGIIEFFEKKNEYKMVPLVFAKAVPNGEVDKKLYNCLKEKFFQYLAEEEQVDAFVLALHGSMRVKSIGSAETDLLSELKKRYPNIPVFCGLDMHATITKTMLDSAIALVGFKTAPHIDAYETGLHTARLADMAIKEKTILTMGFAKYECLIAGEKSETDCEPMKTLMSELNRMEGEEDVCAASLLLGFPWADAQENGVTAVVVTKENQEKADRYAQYLIDLFVQHKQEFCFSSPALPPEKALEIALKDKVKPIFVSDSGDNPTAGSTADNTTIINLLSKQLQPLTNGKKILIAGIYDTQAVNICKKNMHKEITFYIGGNFDRVYCSPIEITGIPISWIKEFGLFKSDLILFRTSCFDLIITSKHIGFTNIDIFEALEIDYLKQDIIVVKLGYLTEEFKKIAAKSYLALSQGCTDEVLERLTYQKKYEFI